jgi:hypothetical protein
MGIENATQSHSNRLRGFRRRALHHENLASKRNILGRRWHLFQLLQLLDDDPVGAEIRWRKQGSISFLKKRNKKLLFSADYFSGDSRQHKKVFCFFFSTLS